MAYPARWFRSTISSVRKRLISVRLLVPTDKNDEGLNDPFSHVTCYEIGGGIAGPAVISTNQFGAQPIKTVPEPGSTLGLVTGALLVRALSRRREKRMQSRRAG